MEDDVMGDSLEENDLVVVKGGENDGCQVSDQGGHREGKKKGNIYE